MGASAADDGRDDGSGLGVTGESSVIWLQGTMKVSQARGADAAMMIVVIGNGSCITYISII